MQKDVDDKLEIGLEIFGSTVFEDNSTLVCKCYKVIFNLEVLVSYYELFMLDDEYSDSYFLKLKWLKSRVNSKIRYKNLRSMKNLRNSLAHDIRSIYKIFTNPKSSELLIDSVLENISIMIQECEEFRKNVNEDKVESTRTKIPDIQKSNLF